MEKLLAMLASKKGKIVSTSSLSVPLIELARKDGRACRAVADDGGEREFVYVPDESVPLSRDFDPTNVVSDAQAEANLGECFMPEEKLEDIFSYHVPTPEQIPKYNAINRAFLDCAKRINRIIPAGAGATVAIRKLSDARMACNAAVALEGRF